MRYQSARDLLISTTAPKFQLLAQVCIFHHFIYVQSVV